MAEPVGLASTVVGLATLAGQICKLSYGIISDIRKASQSQREYLTLVTALQKTLLDMANAVDAREAREFLQGRPPLIEEGVLRDFHEKLASIKEGQFSTVL